MNLSGGINMSKFSERFRALKDKSEMTLKELSNALDISVPNLSYYMKGREPSYDILISIADYFDVTVDWLIGRTDNRSSVYEALEKEIVNTIIKNDNDDISKDDIKPLTIFRNDYLKTQEQLVQFLSFYYTLLAKLEELEKLHPDIDYSSVNDSLTENFIDAIEYQIDFIEDAHMAILASTSNVFFEYYFNSLLRLDSASNRYKIFIAKIMKIGTSNFDGNGEQLSVMVDFLKQIENYGQNCISDVELSSYLKRFGL